MQMSNYSDRFPIYAAKKEGATLNYSFQCGDAYAVEKTLKPYYVVQMWSFDSEVFYLSRNREDELKYTLFKRNMGSDDNPRFQRPIGCAYVSADLKNYLEIQFNFPRQKVFMTLFPKRDFSRPSLIRESGTSGAFEVELTERSVS